MSPGDDDGETDADVLRGADGDAAIDLFLNSVVETLELEGAVTARGAEALRGAVEGAHPLVKAALQAYEFDQDLDELKDTPVLFQTNKNPNFFSHDER